MRKKWLDEELGVNFDRFDVFLDNYFNKINEESISRNGDFLDDLTILELKKKIINEIDEKGIKIEHLTYRNLFELIREVYVLPHHDIDVISEIYKMTLNIYEQKTNINPLFNE